MSDELYIWDSSEPIGDEELNIIDWRGGKKKKSLYSIAEYLEENSVRLRDKYLQFIYQLGHSKIKQKSILEHLALENNFSFWWMTLLAEKSPFKSVRINDCLKILALEEIVQKNKINALILKSSDSELAEAIQELSASMHIRFTWEKQKLIQSWTLRNLYQKVPQPIQGLLSLRHVLLKWKLRNVEFLDWFGGKEAIFMGSYFFNIDRDSIDKNFHSNQWGILSSYLLRLGKKINWLHHYLPSPNIQSPKEAALLMRGLNSKFNLQESHKFVESFFSYGILWKTLKRWLWLNFVSWRLGQIKRNFKVESSHANLWPLLKNDWKNSIVGPYAINCSLWIDLFDKAMSEIPRQNLGLFLWENQGWEVALIKAWNKYGHGIFIGVPHATICFWHLNNFEDPRIFNENGSLQKPMPNFWAVNGPMAWKNLSDGGMPSSRKRRVEALRFSYLSEIRCERHKRVNLDNHHDATDAKRLLVLGDFTASQTHKMLRCVEGASRMMHEKIEVIFKPHPVCAIERSSHPFLDFSIKLSPLNELLREFDIAFVGGSSSVALDAMLSGLSVCVYRDEAELNHSPLRGIEGIDFASNAIELSQFLLDQNDKKTPRDLDEFFWINKKLPLWGALILEFDNKPRVTR